LRFPIRVRPLTVALKPKLKPKLELKLKLKPRAKLKLTASNNTDNKARNKQLVQQHTQLGPSTNNKLSTCAAALPSDSSRPKEPPIGHSTSSTTSQEFQDRYQASEIAAALHWRPEESWPAPQRRQISRKRTNEQGRLKGGEQCSGRRIGGRSGRAGLSSCRLCAPMSGE